MPVRNGRASILYYPLKQGGTVYQCNNTWRGFVAGDRKETVCSVKGNEQLKIHVLNEYRLAPKSCFGITGRCVRCGFPICAATGEYPVNVKPDDYQPGHSAGANISGLPYGRRGNRRFPFLARYGLPALDLFTPAGQRVFIRRLPLRPWEVFNAYYREKEKGMPNILLFPLIGQSRRN